MSGKYDFANSVLARDAAEQGATFDREVVWQDEDDAGDLQPVPIDGYDVIMQVRENAESASVVIELSTTNGRIAIVNGPAGLFRLHVNSADMALIDDGNYVYDIKMFAPAPVEDSESDLTTFSGDDTWADRVETRLLEGRFVVTPAVTR
jgi:hypothetical protein